MSVRRKNLPYEVIHCKNETKMFCFYMCEEVRNISARTLEGNEGVGKSRLLRRLVT